MKVRSIRQTEVLIEPLTQQAQTSTPRLRKFLNWKFGTAGFDPLLLATLLFFGFGLYLRLYGLNIGLPYVVPADESLLVDSAVHVLKAGSVAPSSFYYPTLLINLEAGVFALCFLWGTLTGRYHNLSDIPDKTYFITNAPDFYIWGRAFTAITGALVIVAVFWLVRRVWKDSLAATLAAGFVACSAILVENSHYVATDMPMATLALLAFYPCWRIMETGQRRYYVWAGILIGLAIGTKFNAGLALVMLVTAHLFYLARTAPPSETPLFAAFKRALNPLLLLSLVCMSAAFLISTPDFLSDLRSYTDGFVSNYYKYRFADPTTGSSASALPWLTYLSAFWHDSPVVMLLAGGGLLVLAFRHTRLDLLLLGFPLVYLVSINGLNLVYVRNGIVVLLFFQIWAALFASLALQKAWLWLNKKVYRNQENALTKVIRSRVLILPFLLAGLGLTMFGSIRDSLYGDWFNSRDITYVLAQRWLESEAGPGALKLVEMRPQQWGDYANTLAVGGNDDKQGADDHSLQYYQERGIGYLAVNDLRAQPALSKKVGNYPIIYQQGQLAIHIVGKNNERLGPDFSIIKTGVSAASLKLQHPLGRDFGNELRLLGFNMGVVKTANEIYLPPDGPITDALPTFKAGQIVGLSVYWQPLAQPAHDYVVFIHLVPVGKPDTKMAQRDTQPLPTFPTSQWPVGQIVTDEPNLALPPDLAPGQYQLLMGLYQPDGKFTPLNLTDGQSSLVLATISIEKS